MAVTFQSLIQADATREQIEEWCRSRAQSYAVPDEKNGSSVACRVLGKYIMYGAASDSALTPHLALNGIWEPWVTMATARHVKPGMRCMDVGSCYGYYALLMADIVGRAGHVQAWEPYWIDMVKTNAQINGLLVDTVGAAMASQPSDLSVEPPMGHWLFNAGDVRLSPYSYNGTPERTCAAFAPSAAPWDFIKIDVEGAEADVWEALKGVREVSPNLTVCMEFTPKKHTDPEKFLLQLVWDGFDVGTVGHDGVPRECSIEEALKPDTGDFRMLWLTRAP